MADHTVEPRTHRVRRLAAPAIFTLVAVAGLAAGCGGTTTNNNASNNATGTTAKAGTTSGTGAGAPKADLSSIPTVTVKVQDNGMDHKFTMPSSVPAGLVQIDFQNTGTEPHQVQFMRPKPGITTDQIDAALKGPSPEAGLAFVELTGGSNAVDPGGAQLSISKFEPGTTYYALCFVSDPDGSPHFVHGMLEKLTVTGGSTTGTTPAGSTPPGTAASGFAVPQAQSDAIKAATVGTINMKDFGILLPDNFTGKGWYKVTNDGPQPHEMGILKLEDGMTVDQVKDFLAKQASGANGASSTTTTAMAAGGSGAMKFAADTTMAPSPGGTMASGPKPPFASVGGYGAIDKGNVGWVFLDLPKGNYVGICFVPNTLADPSGGAPDFAPHFMHGMIQPFTIS